MKEATGELNMTVVTIIAIGAVIALFWAMWPTIQKTITNTWNSTAGTTCVTDVNGNMNCTQGNNQYGGNTPS